MKIVLYGNFLVDYCSEVHYAKTLENMGHIVVRLQETTTRTEIVLAESLKADMLVWVHTHSFINRGSSTMTHVLQRLKERGVPTVAYHLDLYMGLKRWQDYENSPYMQVQHFFTVDKLMAYWFNDNTPVEGHYLAAGCFDQEALLFDNEKVNDVIFVGSKGYHKEWDYRPKLINWLAETYRDRFKHIGGDGSGVVRRLDLNHLYGSSKITVGDTLCLNFDYPYYFSDRLFESTARGAFLIFPYIKGIEDYFELGKEIVTYEFGNFEQLKELIDYYLKHDDEREAIRKAGFERAKREHTYTQRWQKILEVVNA